MNGQKWLALYLEKGKIRVGRERSNRTSNRVVYGVPKLKTRSEGCLGQGNSFKVGSRFLTLERNQKESMESLLKERNGRNAGTRYFYHVQRKSQ